MSRIRQVREEKAKLAPAAFTQAAVAARVGVTVNALRAWEFDRARPRKAAAKRLARALGVELKQLGLDDHSPSALELNVPVPDRRVVTTVRDRETESPTPAEAER